MRILRHGLPDPVLETAVREELREEHKRSELKPQKLRKGTAERSRPKTSDKTSEEPPRTGRVPDAEEDSGGQPWFITPL
jgi:hypothetical protein